MKLLYTDFHAGDGGGHTTYVRELARRLASRHEVHVAAPPGSRLLGHASTLPGVQTHAQPFPNGLRRLRQRQAAIRQLHACLHRHRFDVVHVNGSADHRLLIAALRGLPTRPHIVLTKHNTKPMRGPQHLIRAHHRHTGKVIAVCEHVRRQLEKTPYRSCQPQTVHNGVDTTWFSPRVTAGGYYRSQLPLAADTLVIGSNAGTANYKGWTDLVAALLLLEPEERQRIQVVVAGNPPSPQQRAIVDAAGLTARFHFPGLLDDVRPVIAAIDAGFVLSHDIETISFACREMMAMGKPVMVTDYAGLPENVRNGEDGWIVPVHGYAAMAETLRGMLRQPQALRRMGEAARAHAVAEFGVECFVNATENIYRNLLVTPAQAGTTFTMRAKKNPSPPCSPGRRWRAPPSS